MNGPEVADRERELAKLAWAKEFLGFLENKETKEQIKDLKNLSDSYANGSLDEDKRDRYESLMKVINIDLNNAMPDIFPTEMINNINAKKEKVKNDINFLKENPAEAEKLANDIVKDPEAMSDIENVSYVFQNERYLPPEDREKLGNVIAGIIRELSAQRSKLEDRRDITQSSRQTPQQAPQQTPNEQQSNDNESKKLQEQLKNLSKWKTLHFAA